MNVTFERLLILHVKHLTSWAASPHLRATYPLPQDEAALRDMFFPKDEGQITQRFVICVDAIPVGYLQSYDAHRVGHGWWPEATPGTFGIDLFIGDKSHLGQGLGQRVIREFCDLLFANPHVTEIIADPKPSNSKSIRAFTAAGFESMGECITPDGAALLLSLRKPPNIRP